MEQANARPGEPGLIVVWSSTFMVSDMLGLGRLDHNMLGSGESKAEARGVFLWSDVTSCCIRCYGGFSSMGLF